ncbi:MAG TPA: C39 family peptidase [Deltaproteobacteria bacterium]|nr:C39 family peptidase [Deltaproteobacteria bacterium]HOM30237.1 C39 family peptidase [Deltaproteobacteria bacterium]HPP79753.1 C39 family peptidase [Deltaproteobacteria bacterium]
MEVLVAFVIVVTLMGTMYPVRDNPKETMLLYPGMTGVENLSLKQEVTPHEVFKDARITKQKYDYSCGSAALATLLNGYLRENLSEQQIIQGLMQYGEAEKIQQRRAFSLLDMKRFCEVLGYTAAGYKGDFEDLARLDKPAIVPIEISGYKHFVVFRGVYGDHVFLADPYLGNTSYTVNRFKDIWPQKILFIVSSEGVKTNALALGREDLRIIEYDMTKHAYTGVLPPDTVRRQHDFIESQGGRFYRTLFY